MIRVSECQLLREFRPLTAVFRLVDDARADYSLGIDWLLKASYEGHERALILLEKSLKTGRGINDRNIVEVETCLAMTPAERSARKAARELFNCLANGEQHITVAQLEKKMRQIYNLKSCRRRDDQSEQDLSPYHSVRRNVLSSPADNITEAHLITAAMNYSNGRLPPISSSLTLSTPHPDTLDHVPYFHRLLFHPLMFVYLVYHKYLNLITQCPASAINCALFALLLTFSTSVGHLLQLLPVLVYYASLLVMILATFKMFKTKHNFDDFQMWSRLFLSFDQHVDTDASENQFLRKEMQPYLVHFSAFFVNVIVSPAIPVEWKLSSETTIVSFALLFITMFVFMYNTRYRYPDPLTLLSFGLNVLVKFPNEMNATVSSGWRQIDRLLPHLPSFLLGNGIEFCLSCRAMLYLLIPALLLVLARRQRWHGIYQFLIPHCVTLSWLQICIISSQSATTFELVRGALGLAALLFCLPLFGIVTLMIPVFAAVQSLSLTNSTMRAVASVSFAAVALLISCALALSRRTKKYVTLFQVLMCVAASIYVAQPYLNGDGRPEGIYQPMMHHADGIDGSHEDAWTNLRADVFSRYCHTPIRKAGNRISAQLKCERFDGMPVKWEGAVTNVEIYHIFNWQERFLKYLPNVVAAPITCFFGEPNELMFDVYDGDELDYLKSIFKEPQRCNLNHLNVYEYRIGVTMDYGATEIQLSAHNAFANFTKFIDNGDRIWFKGTLSMVRGDASTSAQSAATGSEKNVVRVDVNAIGCLKCRHPELRPVFTSNMPKINSQSLYSGFKYLMNVLFNPLIKIN